MALQMIAHHKPDIVVVGAAWTYDEPGFDLDKIADTIAVLRNIGIRRIVLVGPPVSWGFGGLPQVLTRYALRHFGALLPERTHYGLSENVRAIDDALRQKARVWNVEYVSLWETMCNEEGCLARLGPAARDITAFDPQHLTLLASNFVAEATMPRILGVAPTNH